MDFALDRQQTYSTKTIASIGVTVGLHLVVGYALATGLARDVINVISKPIETRIIEEIKPPPPPPPPQLKAEPPRKFVKPPPAYVPPPEVQVAAAPRENTIATVSTAPPAPVAPAAPPAPVAPVVAKVGLACPDSTRIRQSLEYPRQALQNNISGNVLVQFVVGTDGVSREFSLLRSAHPLLNRAALDAVQRFNCTGQGREVVVQVPFEFKVE